LKSKLLRSEGPSPFWKSALLEFCGRVGIAGFEQKKHVRGSSLLGGGKWSALRG
jgi:hypothetical protein